MMNCQCRLIGAHKEHHVQAAFETTPTPALTLCGALTSLSCSCGGSLLLYTPTSSYLLRFGMTGTRKWHPPLSHLRIACTGGRLGFLKWQFTSSSLGSSRHRIFWLGHVTSQGCRSTEHGVGRATPWDSQSVPLDQIKTSSLFKPCVILQVKQNSCIQHYAVTIYFFYIYIYIHAISAVASVYLRILMSTRVPLRKLVKLTTLEPRATVDRGWNDSFEWSCQTERCIEVNC